MPPDASVFVILILAGGLLWLQPLASLFTRLRRGSVAPGTHGEGTPRLLFLIAAHDEEDHIGACIDSLLALAYPPDAFDVLVIADNCTDRTAAIARGAGVGCLERDDPRRPGKPAALAWALDSIPIRDWDLCIVVDADTEVDPGFGAGVARVAEPRQAVAQAYLGMSNEWENWLTRLAGLFTRIRYELVYPRKRDAGLSCPLTGNGMCLGTDRLSHEGWSAFSLTEDLELYARYTAEGITVDYLPAARLRALEASSLGQAGSQRRRWAAGRLAVLRAYGWRILASRRIRGLQKLDTIAELAGPSPVLHAVFAATLTLLAALLLSTPSRVLVAGVALASLAPLVFDTLSVLRNHPHRDAVLVDLLRLPLYAAWRSFIGMQTLLTLRDTRWRKTDRPRAKS